MIPLPLRSFDLQERHDYILRTFLLNSTRGTQYQRQKRDIDVIREYHKFLWDEDDVPDSWESRLAKKYYERLFKEYCIADLSRFKENKIAMRWRTKEEVITGKGHFQCGSRECLQKDMLRSWEVNFAYLEDGIKKNALVKLRLCDEHSAQLNYVSKKREVKRQKQKAKKRKVDFGEEGVANDSEGNRKCNSDNPLGKSEYGPTMSKKIKGSSNQHIEPNDEKDQLQSENVWTQRKDIDTEANTRENDFERYLEDLLL